MIVKLNGAVISYDVLGDLHAGKPPVLLYNGAYMNKVRESLALLISREPTSPYYLLLCRSYGGAAVKSCSVKDTAVLRTTYEELAKVRRRIKPKGQSSSLLCSLRKTQQHCCDTSGLKEFPFVEWRGVHGEDLCLFGSYGSPLQFLIEEYATALQSCLLQSSQ